MVRRERATARIDGDFVVFLIGMRINRPLRVDRWMPVAAAMPRMLRELAMRPELGLLHADSWVGRTFLVLQYWRSMELLLAYAKLRDSAHLPAWKAFNVAADRGGGAGAVGIWHETYAVTAGRYENIYVDMPPFGLGKAGVLTTVSTGRESAQERLDGC